MMKEAVLLTAAQAAIELGCSKKHVYDLIRERRLPATTWSGRLHVRLEDLEAYRVTEAPTTAGSRNAAMRCLPGSSRATLKDISVALERLLAAPQHFERAPNGVLSLKHPRLALRPMTAAFLRQATGSDDISLGEATILLLDIRRRLNDGEGLGPGSPTRDHQIGSILRSNLVMEFLTQGRGLLLDQSFLIFGRPGTLKTRLAATLAVCATLETARPVIFLSLEGETKHLVQMIEDTVKAWSPAGAPNVSVRLASAEDRTQTGSAIIVFGTATTWDELADEIETALHLYPDAVAMIVDSFGPLGAVERDELSDFILRSHTSDRITVMVGEWAEDRDQRDALEHAMWVSDTVVRVGFDLPKEGTMGPAQRFVELLKSRKQPCLEGRHSMIINADGRIVLAPALEYFDTKTIPGNNSDSMTPNPAFGISELDAYVEQSWDCGAVLALQGGPNTFKEMLCLYAAAEAIRRNASVLGVTLWPNALTVFNHTVKRFPDLESVFTVDGATRFRDLDPNQPHSVGEQPEFHIFKLESPTARAENLLWAIYEAVITSRRQKYPIGLVIIGNFSELPMLPGFRGAANFGMICCRLLAALGVPGLLSINTEAWNRHLLQGNTYDLLQTVRLVMQLEAIKGESGDPTVLARINTYNALQLRLDGKQGEPHTLVATQTPYAPPTA